MPLSKHIPIPGTSDHDTAVARDSAVAIMDGTPNDVGLLINLYYHPFKTTSASRIREYWFTY